MSDNQLGNSPAIARSANRSDRQLIEFVRRGSEEESKEAFSELCARYQSQVRRFARILPPYWRDDLAQEIWKALCQNVRWGEVREGIPQLLTGIAAHKLSDAFDGLKTERTFEGDWPSDTDLTPEAIAAVETPIDDQIVANERYVWLCQQPFAASLFSPCQRAVWVLRTRLDVPPRLIARLTGKRPQTVYQLLHLSKRKFSRYLQSRDYDLFLASQADETEAKSSHAATTTFFVEQFSNPLNPHLMPDELAPIGVSTEEWQSQYNCSFILPRNPPDNHPTQNEPLYLTLTRRSDWEVYAQAIKRLSRRRRMPNVLDMDEMSDLQAATPEEFLLKSTVSGENLTLHPLSFIKLPPTWGKSRLPHQRTTIYLSLHSPRLTIPISGLSNGWWHIASPSHLEELVLKSRIQPAAAFEKWRRQETGHPQLADLITKAGLDYYGNMWTIWKWLPEEKIQWLQSPAFVTYLFDHLQG